MRDVHFVTPRGNENLASNLRRRLRRLLPVLHGYVVVRELEQWQWHGVLVPVPLTSVETAIVSHVSIAID
jgi:hypothetical protein